MIERFLRTYKDGFEVMLNPSEKDEIIEEIKRLNNIIKEIDNLVEKTLQEPLVQEDMFYWFYDKYFELKGSDKE